MAQRCGKAGQRPQQTASRYRGGIGGLPRRIWSCFCSLFISVRTGRADGFKRVCIGPVLYLSGGEECAPAYERLLPALLPAAAQSTCVLFWPTAPVRVALPPK